MALMGYCNTIQNVQREIDTEIGHLGFVDIYVDDMIVRAEEYRQNLRHLRLFFKEIKRLNISLNPKKYFLGYPSVKVLG